MYKKTKVTDSVANATSKYIESSTCSVITWSQKRLMVSPVGGGCSTMGTLSGGGNILISVGKECLIGANAGLGIPLGDRCTIEAGLFVTAGTKVSVLDERGKTIRTVSARTLSGRSDLLFRRHSSTGAVQCLTNKSAVELNEILHANN